jgi:hypothetical protein
VCCLFAYLRQVEPYFNETGSNCPSILPRQQQKELLELSVNSVKVRGMHGSGQRVG